MLTIDKFDMFHQVIHIESVTTILGLIISEMQELPREIKTPQDIDKLEDLRCALSYTCPLLENEVKKAMEIVG